MPKLTIPLEPHAVAAGALNFRRELDRARAGDGTYAPTLTAGWHCNERGQPIEVFADRLGMLPLFCSRDGVNIVVADSLREVLADRRYYELDADALALFLRIGFYVGTDTAFRDIKVLAPGRRWHVQQDCSALFAERSFEKYSVQRIERRQVVSEYGAMFGDAVRARARDGRSILPLSGGRDSRHILLELVRQGFPPNMALTYGNRYWGLAEIAAAGKLCEVVGVQHRIVSGRVPGLLRDETEKNEATHYLTDEHAWYRDVADALTEEGAGTVFDGIGGDVLSNGLFFDDKLLQALRRGCLRDSARRLLGEPSELGYLAPRWQAEFSWERACARLERELRQHVEQPNPIASFYFWNRTCREIALAPVALAPDVPFAFPYVTSDLLDYFLGLPAEEFGIKGLHDEVLAERFPAYAHVAFAKTPNDRPGPPMNWERRLECQRVVAHARRNTFVSKRFALPRLARAVLRREVGADDWWLRGLAYLNGLFAAGNVVR